MSEIDEKEIEHRFVVISQFEPSSEVAARDVEQVRKRLAELTSGQRPREQKIWRIIMKSRIRKLAVAAMVIAVGGVAFTAGYASGTSAMRSAGALLPSDANAAKEMVQEYLKAAKKGNFPLMYQLSDQRWREEHEVVDQTSADAFMASYDIEVSEDVSTTWREVPVMNVALFLRGGSGGMAHMLFVVRENGRWVVDRSHQLAEETLIDSKVKQRADVCVELIEAHREAFDKDGTITVSYQDLTESQRIALEWSFGIVDDSGALTKFGRQLTDLEEAAIQLDRGNGDKIVIHLLTQDDDHFLAVHLKSEN